MQKKYQLHSFKILGTRFGADLATQVTCDNELFTDLYLIEPIIKGSRYLLEQRLRRKSFHKLNNMKNIEDIIDIKGDVYEDHQGYPLSKDVLEFIENVNTHDLPLEGKHIRLYKVNSIFSKKLMLNLVENLSKKKQYLSK